MSVIAFLTVAVGCSTDDSKVEHEHRHNGTAVKTLSFKQLVQEPVFNNAYKKLRKKSASAIDLSNRSAMEEDYGFTIENVPAKVIETDSLISYTLLVSKDSLKTDVFENLVLQVDKNSGATQAVIFSNKVLSPVSETSDGSYSFESEKEIVPLLDETMDTPLDRTTICVTVKTLMCRYEYEHVAGPNCGSTYWDYSTECTSTGGVGSGGGGSGGSFPGETSGPGGVLAGVPDLDQRQSSLRHLTDPSTSRKRSLFLGLHKVKRIGCTKRKI